MAIHADDRTTRGPRPDWRPLRALALLLMLPVGGVVLLGTLGPPEVAEAACTLLVRLAGRWTGTTGWAPGYTEVQTVANAVMFAPLSALLALGTRPSRWPLMILVGPAVSAALEQAQRFLPGRVPDSFDVLTNATGSVVGFLAGAAVVGVVALVAALALLARGPHLPAPASAGR